MPFDNILILAAETEAADGNIVETITTTFQIHWWTLFCQLVNFLIVCLVRAIRGDFTPEKHFGFEAAAWYWHFVDVVWLFLFIVIYVWGGWGAPVYGG